jgi:hypothetical protein
LRAIALSPEISPTGAKAKERHAAPFSPEFVGKKKMHRGGGSLVRLPD